LLAIGISLILEYNMSPLIQQGKTAKRG
jgi:hypothetical protein